MKTSDFIKKLDIRFDVYALKREWRKLQKNVNIQDRQISLSHTPDCPEDERWHQGNGGLFWDHKNPGLKNTEKSFSIINTQLEDSYLHYVCNIMKKKFNIGRIRFMVMEPEYTYPVHHDFERRWHLAIEAPRDSFMYFRLNDNYVFDEDLINSVHGVGFHVPDDGFVYEIDTGMNHTAVNCGNFQQKIDRVHLVFGEAII
jgi:hypothetical protein